MRNEDNNFHGRATAGAVPNTSTNITSNTLITTVNFNQQLSPLYQWSIPAMNIFFKFTEQLPLYPELWSIAIGPLWPT